jgi:hypothetical protein
VPFRLHRNGMMMASWPVGAIGGLRENGGARRKQDGRGDEFSRHDQDSIAKINEPAAAMVSVACFGLTQPR